MKRPSIKTVILSILGTVAVAVVALSITSLASLQSTRAAAEQVGEYWIERLLTVREIKENFTNLRLVLAREGMSAGDAKSFEAAEKAVKEARISLDNTLARFEKGNDTERGRSILKNIRTALGSYDAKMEEYRKLIRSGKVGEASSLFATGAKPEADRVRSKISELADYIMESTRMTVASGDDRANQAFFVTLGAAIATVLLCIGGMVFAVAGIATPIRRITSAMRALAAGDEESPIPYSGRADEVGAMAGAVEVFRQNAISSHDLEQQAVLSRNATEEQRQAEQQRIERESAQLRIATQSLGESLRRLASGDLTCRIEEQFADAYEPLRDDFNAALDQLNRAMGAVAAAVQNMESGTRGIANGASDLSRRTEQQAASLEETSGALDQITSNVAGSSKLTEVARSVAQEATSSAATSATVVSHAVEAMGRIAESSQQISTIVGVIDEIAFQTNLLALNAGVEAARAGETGKGFAVVAHEVRELAQRSAKAAKEIKGLIQKSTAEVESGVRLVRDTGGALQTIGDFITEINRHMQAIASSAQEQATGLSEVNVAVLQMDQGTQQNAALVEQSTASAAALSTEAARLRHLVEQFRLDRVSPGAATPVNALVADSAAADHAGVGLTTATGVRRRVSQGNLALKDEWQDF